MLTRKRFQNTGWMRITDDYNKRWHSRSRSWIVQSENVQNLIPRPVQTEELPDIKLGDVYRHTNGNEYKVSGLTNMETTRPDEYPVTVTYTNNENGSHWSRSLADWNRSFTKVEPSVSDTSTPEEDEAFADLEKKLSTTVPDDNPVIVKGRKIEHFGKVMQNPHSTIREIASAAVDAGFNVLMRISPADGGATNET